MMTVSVVVSVFVALPPGAVNSIPSAPAIRTAAEVGHFDPVEALDTALQLPRLTLFVAEDTRAEEDDDAHSQRAYGSTLLSLKLPAHSKCGKSHDVRVLRSVAHGS